MEKQTKKMGSVKISLRDAIIAALDSGLKINEAAGKCGIKRSEAQRILDDKG